MTYSQIEKTISFIEIIKTCKNDKELERVVNQLKNYYGDSYDANLILNSLGQMYADEYTAHDLQSDKESLTAFLQGLVEKEPNNEEVLCIISDIKKAEESLKDNTWQRYFEYLYGAYSQKISFPKAVVDYMSGSRRTKFDILPSINTDLFKGVLQSIKTYGISLLIPKKEEHGPTSITEVHYSPSNQVTVSVNIDIKTARQMAEEAGLSESQLKEVNDKIDELESLIQLKESKAKKWSKAGSILKWVAEQSIAIASFMVPLLCQIL